MANDDQQWIKLFRYLDTRFKEVDERFEKMEQKFDGFRISMDGIAKRIDDDDIERAAIMSQVDRHEGWIHQLAHKLSTKLG